MLVAQGKNAFAVAIMMGEGSIYKKEVLFKVPFTKYRVGYQTPVTLDSLMKEELIIATTYMDHYCRIYRIPEKKLRSIPEHHQNIYAVTPKGHMKICLRKFAAPERKSVPSLAPTSPIPAMAFSHYCG